MRFRTGNYGNILPNGGVEQTDCKVVFLGGSTTESRWMDEDKRWPFLVGNNLNDRDINIATLNFGSGGQNLHHSLQKFISVIMELQPNIVVVNHLTNDISKAFKGVLNSFASRFKGLLKPF